MLSRRLHFFSRSPLRSESLQPKVTRSLFRDLAPTRFCQRLVTAEFLQGKLTTTLKTVDLVRSLTWRSYELGSVCAILKLQCTETAALPDRINQTGFKSHQGKTATGRRISEGLKRDGTDTAYANSID